MGEVENLGTVRCTFEYFWYFLLQTGSALKGFSLGFQRYSVPILFVGIYLPRHQRCSAPTPNDFLSFAHLWGYYSLYQPLNISLTITRLIHRVIILNLLLYLYRHHKSDCVVPVLLKQYKSSNLLQ